MYSRYRLLQDRVDKLEADKESLVNHIYDLRQLLHHINANGESKITYIKNKNASLKGKIADLRQSLTISRQSARHMANMRSYWQAVVEVVPSTEKKLKSMSSSESLTVTSSQGSTTVGSLSVPTLSPAVSVDASVVVVGSGNIGGGIKINRCRCEKREESEEEPMEPMENLDYDLLLCGDNDKCSKQQQFKGAFRPAAKSADREELISEAACAAAEARLL